MTRFPSAHSDSCQYKGKAEREGREEMANPRCRVLAPDKTRHGDEYL